MPARQRAWLAAPTRAAAFALLPLAGPFAPLRSDLGPALFAGFGWVDAFLSEQ